MGERGFPFRSFLYGPAAWLSIARWCLQPCRGMLVLRSALWRCHHNGGAPAPAGTPSDPCACACARPSGGSGARRRRPACRNYGQLPQFTGAWVDHPDPEYRGIYDQASECPGWGYDFNCMEATSEEERKPELLAREYRKVFRPHECDLPEWDAHGFDKCALRDPPPPPPPPPTDPPSLLVFILLLPSVMPPVRSRLDEHKA